MELGICAPLLYKMKKEVVSVSFRIYYANSFVKKRRITTKNLSNDYQSQGPNRLKRVMKLWITTNQKKKAYGISDSFSVRLSSKPVQAAGSYSR